MSDVTFSSDAVGETPVVGAMVDHYRITSVGEGPMGAECAAVDTSVDGPAGGGRVVISFLSELVKHVGDEAIRGILTEVRAAAKFRHPGVLRVCRIGKTPAGLCLVTEFSDAPGVGTLPGRSGPLTPHEATVIVRDTAGILRAIHDAGLTHRDIKPDNILVDADGTVRVARLGQTRVLEELQQFKLGLRLVTPAYTAPEVYRNETAGPRSDLYSLGAVYYELLTGSPPFTGGTSLQILHRHVSEPPPDPRRLRPGLPEGCVAVLAKAMAKNPADRFADGDAMAEALTALLPEMQRSAVPTASRGVESRPKPAAGTRNSNSGIHTRSPDPGSAIRSGVRPSLQPTSSGLSSHPATAATKSAVRQVVVHPTAGVGFPVQVVALTAIGGLAVLAGLLLFRLLEGGRSEPQERDTVANVGVPKAPPADPPADPPDDQASLLNFDPLVGPPTDPPVAPPPVTPGNTDAPTTPTPPPPAKTPKTPKKTPKTSPPPVIPPVTTPAPKDGTGSPDPSDPFAGEVLRMETEYAEAFVGQDARRVLATVGALRTFVNRNTKSADPSALRAVERVQGIIDGASRNVEPHTDPRPVAGSIWLVFSTGMRDGIDFMACDGMRLSVAGVAEDGKTTPLADMVCRSSQWTRQAVNLDALKGTRTKLQITFRPHNHTLYDHLFFAEPRIVRVDGPADEKGNLPLTVVTDLLGLHAGAERRVLRDGAEIELVDGAMLALRTGPDPRLLLSVGGVTAPGLHVQPAWQKERSDPVMIRWAVDLTAFPARKADPAPAEPGLSRTFDGTSWLEVADTRQFDLHAGDFTVHARVKAKGTATILARTDDAATWAPGGMAVFIRNGRLTFDVGWTGFVPGTTAIADDKWHDVAVTWKRDTGEVRIFVDGRDDTPQMSRTLMPKSKLKAPVVRIGHAAADFPRPPHGQVEISHIRFFDAVLAPEEVSDPRKLEAHPALAASWRPATEKSMVVDRAGNTSACEIKHPAK